MAQLRRRSGTSSHPLPGILSRSKEPLTLFSMLPTAVQFRLPRLPSLSRSSSTYGGPSKKSPLDSRTSSRASSSSASLSITTPDLSYKSAIVLGTQTAREIRGEDGLVGYFDSLSSEEEPRTPKARVHKDLDLTESKSGIGWKFASQGLNLLSLVVNESSSISQDPSFGNANFARQLYLHALAYLIQALPPDLTPEEQLSLRSSLPEGVVDPLHLDFNGYTQQPASKVGDSQPSLLHRVLASSIVQLFVFLQFILPYIKFLVSAAYRYDRKHKISEKVLGQGIEAVDSLGKTGLSVTGAIYGMGDGKVGQFVTETMAWIVQGVTGGIHEGFGEGMAIMGAPGRISGSDGK